MNTKILVVPAPSEAAEKCGLARVDFSDGYMGRTRVPNLTAIQGARAIFENPPRVAVWLMALRNRLVAAFKLKKPNELRGTSAGQGMVGIFPLISESAAEVVIGGDDRHLDFRIWVCVHKTASGHALTMSTLVSCNNRFGKIYLACVMPFHRLLSRTMLRRGLQKLASSPLHTDTIQRR